MEKIKINIKTYEWTVMVFVGVDTTCTDDVEAALKSIGCKEAEIKAVHTLLKNDKKNEGVTFSNFSARKSVMIVEATSSPEEFLDSLVHECMHVAIHISTSDDIDTYSEEPCYLAGEFAKSIYPECKNYLCCKCQHK